MKTQKENSQVSIPTRLYHGTSERYLASILSNGILPRGQRKGNWPDVPSRPNAVYLTTAYPFYFGLSATQEDGPDKAVVIEIDINRLDPKRLEPDEDFIDDCICARTGQSLAVVIPQVRRSFRQFRQFWRESLAGMGCCAYRNRIPASAITRYCVFDPEVRPFLTTTALDPVICPANYRACRDKYEGLVAWMFGDRQDLLCLKHAYSPQQCARLPQEFLDEIAKYGQFLLQESPDRNGIEVVTVHGSKAAVATKSSAVSAPRAQADAAA
jgi:hypothetical protein